MDKNGKLYFEIDGKACYAEAGQSVIDAAKANGVFIPSLCHVEGVKAAGSCRVCNVKVNGRMMTACTTPVTEDMVVENDTEELNELRKTIIEGADAAFDEALSRAKRHLNVSTTSEYDDLIRETLNRRLTFHDGIYIWPDGMRAVLFWWHPRK